MGGTSAGVVMDVTKKGLSINGYYCGNTSREVKYANVRDPVFVSWEDLEKARAAVLRPKRKRTAKAITPDRIDEPDKKYLEGLPQVTINGAKYYIDADRRERRAVKNPKQVFKF